MAHVVNEAAEKILDQTFPVLDHGFVRLVDYLGGDLRIVQAARVSYGRGSKGEEKDRELIDFLLRHDHTSPFEQVVFTFDVKMPIFVARQWIRHRTARINEVSGRYRKMPDEFYVPEDEKIHLQNKDNRQGRDEKLLAPLEVRATVRSRMEEHNKQAYEHYRFMLKNDISREVARIALPLSLYTEFYWQMDLHNLFHFLRLRLDDEAQLEIREYAKALAEIVKIVTPWAWDSFENHILKGARISADEAAAIKKMIAGQETGFSEERTRELRKKLRLES